MNKLGQIVFDMDGTLVDAMNQHAEAFSRILKEEYGIPSDISKREYFRTAGQPLDEQFSHVVWTSRKTHVADMAKLLDRFWLIVDELTPVLFTDVHDTIEHLSKAGYVLVVTSGCAPFVVESKMRKTELAPFLTLMLGTDKNVPDMVKGEGHFRIVRRTLGLAPEQFQMTTAIVGDSEHDIKLGREAGIIAIGRTNGENKEALAKAGADWVIDDLTELVTLLRDSEHSSAFLPISELWRRKQ